MRDSRPQLLEILFDDTSTLRNVQQRAIALLKLNRTVQALLPAQMHPWCRVANYRKGVLVLETANASWLMRLRYEQSNLLTALRAEILPSLASVDIRINPALMRNTGEKSQIAAQQPVNETEKAAVRHLSKDSAEHLMCLANRSPAKLKEKLERLASLAGERANVTSRKK